VTALNKLRILELSGGVAGEYCGKLLADFGAEVIKIEDPQLGDYIRWQEPRLDESSAVFHSLNRNKKSVSLNLKAAEGKEIFNEMAMSADVVIESFRPGVMKRLGLGYEKLKEFNPELIYCSLTGFGQYGPHAESAGHDLNFLAYSGLLSLFKTWNERPSIPAMQIADLGGGALPAAIGILLALLEREKTGSGQFVDIAMLDGLISLMQTTLPDYLASGKISGKEELPLSGGKACYEVYETRDGQYLAVAALEKKFWEVFCNAIGREDLIERHHAPVKVQNQMKAEIQSVIVKRPLSDWMESFKGMDACVSPVSTIDSIVENPQVQAREMIQTFFGIHHIGVPIKLSKTPGGIRSKAPQLGQHTDEYLKEIGLSEKEIVQLRKKKVIAGEKRTKEE